MAVDMHVHTSHSDSRIRVPDLLRYAERLHIGVAITDHNEIGGVLEAYRNPPRIPVIPGIEVSAAEGPHILLYFATVDELESFYSDHILGNRGGNPFMAVRLSTEEVLDRAGMYSCLRVAAHPFGYAVLNRGLLKCIGNGTLPERLASRVDAFEVICGGMGRRLNRKAAGYAERKGTGITAGSDAHLLRSVGTVLTLARAAGIGEFLGCVRNAKVRVAGRGAGPLERGLTAGVIGAKFLPYTIPSLRVHYWQNAPRFRASLRRLFR
jgi:predicted metal-dependent phosphoesterase TrpH